MSLSNSLCLAASDVSALCPSLSVLLPQSQLRIMLICCCPCLHYCCCPLLHSVCMYPFLPSPPCYCCPHCCYAAAAASLPLCLCCHTDCCCPLFPLADLLLPRCLRASAVLTAAATSRSPVHSRDGVFNRQYVTRPKAQCEGS